MNVNHFVKGYNLSNVDADVKLHGGKLTANVDSHAGDVVGNFNVAGTMGSRMTDLTIATDLKKAPLQTEDSRQTADHRTVQQSGHRDRHEPVLQGTGNGVRHQCD